MRINDSCDFVYVVDGTAYEDVSHSGGLKNLMNHMKCLVVMKLKKNNLEVRNL